MNAISNELIQMVQTLADKVTLPRVKSLVIPPATGHARNKYAKFGLLILEDGSSGFFYRLLDMDAWLELDAKGEIDRHLQACKGADPAVLARLLNADDPLSRGLGMAAINAVSQHVLKRINFQANKVSREPVAPGKHIGMVGFFEPMIKEWRKSDVKISVLELDETLYRQDELLSVSGDIERLTSCNTVYCTASTLLNNSLPGILEALAHTRFELIGPTCACFADPLFARGVNKIGSAWVVDTDRAVANILALEPWGNTVMKYEITPDGYPGFERILEQLTG